MRGETMVTVYADTLVCINMFITYFLLLASELLCRRPPRRIRLLCASALGGLYALTLLLEPIPLWISVSMRIFACLILALIADGFRTVRQFLKYQLIFLLCNFMLAGWMLLMQFLRPDRFLYDGGILYFDVNVPFLLLATLGAYLLIQLFTRLSAGKHDDTPVVSVSILSGEKAVQCIGIVDTGHRLRDPFSGRPVLIVTAVAADKLVPEAVQPFLHGKALSDCSIPPEFTGSLRLYPFHSVGAKGLLPAFRTEQIRLECGSRSYEQNGAFIAVCDMPVFGGEADALLPQEMYEAMEENDHAVQNHRLQSHMASHPADAVLSADPLHRLLTDASAAARQKRRSRRARPFVRRR